MSCVAPGASRYAATWPSGDAFGGSCPQITAAEGITAQPITKARIRPLRDKNCTVRSPRLRRHPHLLSVEPRLNSLHNPPFPSYHPSLLLSQG